MFGAWVTTNVSQRIVGLLVQLPAPVTFNMSQLGLSVRVFLRLAFAKFPSNLPRPAASSIL